MATGLRESPLTAFAQRLGRKTLLSASATGAFLSLVGVGYGLDSGVVAVASVTILTFVAYVLCCQSANMKLIPGSDRSPLESGPCRLS